MYMKLLIVLWLGLLAIDAQAVNKCVVNGKTTYQSGPCADASQAVAVKIREITDEERAKSAAAKQKLDEKYAAEKSAKEKVAKEQAIREAQRAQAYRRNSANAAAIDYIMHDNTTKALAQSAMKLHRLSGR